MDGLELAGKKQNIDSMWKRLMKQVDLGDRTSFLDHVYLGCTQQACETSKDIVDNHEHMFASRILWKVMQRNVWSVITNWRTKQPSNCTKSQLHALTTPKCCSQIVLKCPYLARIGRPDILWSVNKLARTVTKWTRACDKRLARLIC